MIDPSYTPNVKRLADEIGELDIGELLALRESLRDYFDIDGDGPDIGVREPRPSGPRPGVFDMRRQLGRAPTAQEYRDAGS